MTLTAFLTISMWVVLFRYFYVRKNPIESIVDEITMIMWQLNISCLSYLLIREECDLKTGECYIIRSKDGIVERINKKFITEDGRQLLQD